MRKIVKNREYYQQLKLSKKDMQSAILSFDIQLETLMREADRHYDDLVHAVQIVNNVSPCIANIATQIETDQFDEKHYSRMLGGNIHRDMMTNIKNLKDYSESISRSATRYFDSCERINMFICLRDTLIRNANKATDIVKQKDSIQSVIDAHNEDVEPPF